MPSGSGSAFTSTGASSGRDQYTVRAGRGPFKGFELSWRIVTFPVIESLGLRLYLARPGRTLSDCFQWLNVSVGFRLNLAPRGGPGPPIDWAVLGPRPPRSPGPAAKCGQKQQTASYYYEEKLVLLVPEMSFANPIFHVTPLIYTSIQTVPVPPSTGESENHTRDELDGYIAKLDELEDLLGRGLIEFGLELADVTEKQRQENSVVSGKEAQALLKLQQKLAVVRSGVSAAVKNPSLDEKPYIATTDYLPPYAHFPEQFSNPNQTHNIHSRTELRELKGKTGALRTALLKEIEGY